MPAFIRAIAAAAAVLIVSPLALRAQAAVRPRPIELPPGMPTVIEAGRDERGGRRVAPFYANFGGTLMAIQPRSDFAQHARRGFGASVQGFIGLDRVGIAGLRGDASNVIYGSNDFADTSVANNISSFLVGPQLTIPWGPIRPYVSGGVGLAHLYSSVSYDCAPVNQCETTWNEETEEYETETRTTRTKHHRFTYAWSRRAGVNIALHRLTHSNLRVALDVSVGEHGNGRTQYGIPGEKEKLATGKTRYRVWLVGVSLMNR